MTVFHLLRGRADEREHKSADTEYCARITREHGRTFALASRLFPGPKKRGAYALYAFCRVADDIVDAAVEAPTADARARHAAALAEYRAEFLALIAERDGAAPRIGTMHRPIFRELRWTMDTFHVPAAPLLELLDGVALDLAPAAYRTWADLERYCNGVASSVGDMCTYVFGLAPGATFARAIPLGRTLGTAMQLTNILRDIGEDARRGRCYLPLDELAAHDLTIDEVLDHGARADASLAQNPRWQRLMQLQIARARALYAEGEAGIPLLHPDARGCAAACATGYAGILGVIERAQYDTISQRARVGRVARAQILWGAWRGNGGELTMPVTQPAARYEIAAS
ncbi:MAG: phytoene/squalene synthase family protein [Gemmatimonadaceae bacterium]|jgi:phytoene synthase|nr:phytoene/squalene synthase family protein [Gemmatimonadaceae bacterium]